MTELQGAHEYVEGTTEADTDPGPPGGGGSGRSRHLLASVGRGLRAIFRPAVIATLAAVVAAGALVVVAIEQREQTDWQRRQTCLAWFEVAVAAEDPSPGGPTGNLAAEECGGEDLGDDDHAVPGAE